MIKIFTERSHHLKISVIFITQKIFHPGKKSPYYIIEHPVHGFVKNPRERQQIQTLARQMYPNCSKYFLDKFEKATNKKLGKLIDLHPNTRETDRYE